MTGWISVPLSCRSCANLKEELDDLKKNLMAKELEDMIKADMVKKEIDNIKQQLQEPLGNVKLQYGAVSFI